MLTKQYAGKLLCNYASLPINKLVLSKTAAKEICRLVGLMPSSAIRFSTSVSSTSRLTNLKSFDPLFKLLNIIQGGAVVVIQAVQFVLLGSLAQFLNRKLSFTNFSQGFPLTLNMSGSLYPSVIALPKSSTA